MLAEPNFHREGLARVVYRTIYIQLFVDPCEFSNSAFPCINHVFRSDSQKYRLFYEYPCHIKPDYLRWSAQIKRTQSNLVIWTDDC